MSEPSFVRIFRVTVGRGSKRRLETRIAAITDPLETAASLMGHDSTVAVFQVGGCPSADSAVGAVAEYLVKDRPDLMTVRQVYRDGAGYKTAR